MPGSGGAIPGAAGAWLGSGRTPARKASQPARDGQPREAVSLKRRRLPREKPAAAARHVINAQDVNRIGGGKVENQVIRKGRKGPASHFAADGGFRLVELADLRRCRQRLELPVSCAHDTGGGGGIVAGYVVPNLVKVPL